MLRDKNLIPLSHQHQHALALCVRIDRATQAGDVALEPWQAEIQQIYQQEIAVHFAAEEKILFPAASRFPELQALVRELIADHARLREYFDSAASRAFDQQTLRIFGQTLSQHVRKEERELFEGMQRLMSAEELSSLGAALERELEAAVDTCIVPTEATRLRPKT